MKSTLSMSAMKDKDKMRTVEENIFVLNILYVFGAELSTLTQMHISNSSFLGLLLLSPLLIKQIIKINKFQKKKKKYCRLVIWFERYHWSAFHSKHFFPYEQK